MGFKFRRSAIFYAILALCLITLPQVWPLLQNKTEKDSLPDKVQLLYGDRDEASKAERQDQPDQAMLYEKLLRSEFGKPFSYPGNWRFTALELARKELTPLKVSGDRWQERGPFNIGGRTRAIIVHPQKPNIWWVGSVGGGIWKTEDAGEHWRSVSDDLPALAVSTMALCLAHPDTLYAGTGEGFGNYDAIVGDGIFKSTDGGEHWWQLSATAGLYNFRYVNRLIVHPAHADTVLAATNTGIFRTLDGGENWQNVLNASGVQQIAANPANFNSLFATVKGDGIYKSTDMGLTWQKVSADITDPRRIEMAIAPSDTNYVYAAVANSDGGLKAFYQSRDAGLSWQNLGASVNWLGKQGWYDNVLLVHPFNAHIVFVGGIDLYQINLQNDNMQTTQISSWWGGNNYPYVHADQHGLAAITHADSSFAIIATNDGGIFYSPDGGVHWQNKNNGYNVTQFYDGARHPFLDQFIGGTQDNGTLLSPTDPDAQSAWQQVVGGDGFDCAWNPYDPYTVYATLYNSRIYKSTDGGQTFSPANSGLPQSQVFHTPLIMDPFNPQKLFTVSGENKIFITYNGAQNWQGFDVNLNSGRWVRIAVSQVDSSVVWIAANSNAINVSFDGGKTFTPAKRPDDSPNAILTGLATHPADSATAFALFGVYGYGKIFRTRDFGRTWQDITNNLPEIPVHCALVMPYDTTQIWIGTDIGLFISHDDGQTWDYAQNSLPAVSIRRLKIVNKEIVAVTHGRGIWSLHDDRLPALVVPPLPPELRAVLPPHPLTHQMKIQFRSLTPYDSLQVLVNDYVEKRLGPVKAYVDTFAQIKVYPPDYLEIQVLGFKNGRAYASKTKTRFIYEAIDSLKEGFNGGSSDFLGDFFIDQPAKFSSQALQTPHPYDDQREYIALLGPPLKIGKNYQMRYKDIALVEPGEAGHFYPDEQMWDYVTVEGSTDGEHWQILTTPYDCRFNPQWQSYYENNKAPQSSMYVSHTIDLNAYFTPGQLVYIRFRLHADPYTHGWGWIIDDVKIGPKNATGLAPTNVPVKFRVFDNYPNPFNPSTTIAFTLDRNEKVTLKIYNAAGQLVRTLLNGKALFKGNRYRFRWQGRNDKGNPVASGVYFYRLKTARHRVVKKMILLR